MKKLFLISILSLLLYSCTTKERLSPKYKGWLVIDKKLMNLSTDEDYDVQTNHQYRVTIQYGNLFKDIDLYDVDVKYKVGDTIK